MKQTQHIPTCIGFIMDGNRRFAEARGMERYLGHHEGYKKLKEVMGWAKEHGVKDLIVYALSTENWKRSEKEITVLLNLLRKMVTEELSMLKKENVCMRFAGQIERFPEDIQQNMRTVQEETKDNTGGTLTVLVSYGGRAEIVSAAQEVVQTKEEITEESLGKHMWLADIPAPDMIVRTGGEKRLSNFLLWYAAYSELYFTDTFWPALTKEEFGDIIAEYGRRNRRYGS